jgi:hypothetical protein
METRNCQNCKKDFIVEPEDFNFYEKIKVPPPTWCPQCRMIRRLIWRNEHSLFKRPNSAPGKQESIVSIFHPEERVITYDRETWWGDSWDPCNYGSDYDFSRSFFEQFRELIERVPHMPLFDSKSVNSNFCNTTVEQKNGYLISASWRSEDCMYCNRMWHGKFTNDSYTSFNTEFCYENVYATDCNKLFFSRECEGCLDSYFLYDCKNCSDCILCTNLRNKSYCIENIQYTREEYLKKKKELALNTRSGITKARKRFQDMYAEAIHRHLKLINTVNVSGDQVSNSRNCQYLFDFRDDAENVKFACWGAKGLKDSYDVGPGCGDNSELNYEGSSVGVQNSQVKFSAVVWYSHNIYYSYMLNNCSNCFGCAEMNAKQYCIFNKQYTKEEYEKLVPKIIEQMKDITYTDQNGREYSYGEFFPPELSPFAYNETIAQDYFPTDKVGSEKIGSRWREYTSGVYKITIKGVDLPETIEEVTDSIIDEVIECEITQKPFRITKQELIFYRMMNIPLPSIHPDERHNRRLKLRNPMILRKRMCFFGDKEVDTTYLPVEEGGPEKVVCTEHYNKEIY